MSSPLAGVSVFAADGTGPSVVASRLLADLGADVTNAASRPIDVALVSVAVDDGFEVPTARLLGPSVGDVAGLPSGTLAYAAGLGLSGAAVLALLCGDDVEVDRREVAVQVLLPLVMAASYGATPREPLGPRPIGNGFVQADLATQADVDEFERLLVSLGPKADDAESVADEAQAWRLPVCAYRDRPIALPFPGEQDGPRVVAPRRGPSAPAAPLRGVTVCDFTTMWGGPLATWLLAAAGADVHKVEPSLRIDGIRAIDGRGIHPPGATARRGDTSALFNALNRGKRRRDLDLRTPHGMAELEALIGGSDLVVDSFSRRVMPNLGLTPERLRAISPTVASLSMPAFPADHAWQVALGPGIHAATGLGDIGGGRVSVPVVAYPDPLAGLAAFTTAVAALFAARRGAGGDHHEVTLYECTTPLATRRGRHDVVAERNPHLGRQLFDDAELAENGAWEMVDDGAGRHRYPRGPFQGPWSPVNLPAAPSLNVPTPAQ